MIVDDKGLIRQSISRRFKNSVYKMTVVLQHDNRYPQLAEQIIRYPIVEENYQRNGKVDFEHLLESTNDEC